MVGNGRPECCYGIDNVVCGRSTSMKPLCLSLQLHRRGFCTLVLDCYDIDEGRSMVMDHNIHGTVHGLLTSRSRLVNTS